MAEVPSTPRPHRVLRVLLLLLALDALVKGLVLLFGGRTLLVRLFPSLSEPEIAPLLLLSRQEGGVASLVLALLLFFAFRNPVRNVAVVYAIAVGLSLGAIQEVTSIYTLGAGRFYSVWLVWVHALGRVAIAALLLFLRPRGR